MHIGNVDRGAGAGPNSADASQPIPLRANCRISRYGPSDQPWSLGGVRSKPNLESSLRAISRRRPNARKMRRRLMALAGATDKTISGRNMIIAYAVRLTIESGTALI